MNNTKSRVTFKAPPVEPAEAPITIKISKADLANDGQTLKSVVTKPVVVIIDTAWKLLYLKASPMDIPILFIRFRAMKRLAPMRRTM